MPLPSDLELQLVDSIDSAMEMKRWLGERRDVLGLDTETSGLDPFAPDAKLRLIQIGDERKGWAVPWEQWGGAAMECLNAWDGQIVGHNISFDEKWLRIHAKWKAPWHRIHDTMIMAQMMQPGQPAGLKPLSVKYVDRRADAGQVMLKEAMSKQGWTWGNIPVDYPAYWNYSALDPVITAYLWKHFRADQVYPASYDLEMAVRRICSRMEENGAPIDVEYCERTRDKLEEYVVRGKQWARDEMGINIGSNVQLIKYFTEQLDAEIERRTPKGAPSLDKDQLAIFAAHDDKRVADLASFILSVRKADKLRGTYFDNFLKMHSNGILHPSIRTLQAVTGRMSIVDPALQTLGKNDATVRGAFVPRDGESIISSDLDQVEFRMFACLAQDQSLCATFRRADETGSDAFTEIGREIYNDPNMIKDDKRRGLVKNCVPLDSMILTKRGWLAHDEVKSGDETLGYNFTTGTNQWTKVLDVYHSQDAQVYRMGNKFKSFRCTYDHRWVMDSGRGPLGHNARFGHAYEIPGKEHRVILAAPAESGGSDITPHEATVLGWVLGDGYIKRSKYVGAPSQGRNGWKTGCYMGITQTKPYRVQEIHQLVSGISHKVEVRDTGQHLWKFKSGWSRRLLTRAQIHDKSDFDPWQLALSLSAESRLAMLGALQAADGKSGRDGEINIIQLAGSPVAELCVALAYLTGHHTRIHYTYPDGVGWQKQTCAIVYGQPGRMTGQKVKLTPDGIEDVWCVTTELGTWTMRQGDDQSPVITGNTIYGKLYGASVKKQAITAKVPYDQMKAVSDALEGRYPGIKQYQAQMDHDVMSRIKTEGQGYITTAVTGRRIPIDEDRPYTGLNYTIQSSAAEIFKRNLVRLDANGLTDMLMIPVHDEIVMSVPNDQVEDVMRLTQECMTTTDWMVPLTAGVDGPYDNWGAKYERKK